MKRRRQVQSRDGRGVQFGHWRGRSSSAIPPEELEGGIRYMTGVLPLRLETTDGISRTILEMELYNLGFDYISRYPAIIRALTPEIVGDAARRHLSSENYVVTIAGPPVD